MQVCCFPGCDHEFPDHYVLPYCGAHSKRDICVDSASKLHDPSVRPDVELAVDAVIAHREKNKILNWAFVEATAMNIHDKRIQRAEPGAQGLFWNLPRDEQESIRLLVRRVIQVSKHYRF